MPPPPCSLLLLFAFVATSCFAQGSGTQVASGTSANGADPTALLGQINQAFSQGKPVTDVAMRGTATWTGGGTPDSGPVTITITPDGSARVNLGIPSAQLQAESSSGNAEGRRCQWSDNKGTSHEVDSRNCWKTMFWFLPPYSLQPGVNPTTEQAVADDGLARVGSSQTLYRDLQSQFIFNLPSMADTKEAARVSTVNLGVDSATFLPAALTYSLFPDSGADTPINVEVRYAKYSSVNGIELPFSIQRYINGTLQLDIAITSADAH